MYCVKGMLTELVYLSRDEGYGNQKGDANEEWGLGECDAVTAVLRRLNKNRARK